MNESYDFCGWATRANLRCSDGRIILKDAFKNNNGKVVPLVWNHQHDNPENVLGHALLENRPEGVYAYCKFNNNETSQKAKACVQNGDIASLSIYANNLKQNGSNVVHGAIREVSLVIAGANPGAYIDSIKHDDESEEEAIIYNNDSIELFHTDDKKKEESEMEKNKASTDEKEKTIEEVFNTFTEEQKNVVYALIGLALENESNSDEEEEDNKEMKHNVFETEESNNNEVLSHAEMAEIVGDAKRYGSLKESVLAHGIENVEYLFPEYQSVNGNAPEFIRRKPKGWVQTVMNGVHHTPFSRVKMAFADIRSDEARARGYLKGGLKKEEVFGLLKRVIEPTTVYKKQKMDRDDVVDITDFDVVTWLKSEMRGSLDEELARAYIFGDGRSAMSEDKISETNIIPIVSDAELFTIHYTVTPDSGESLSHAIIDAAVKAQDDYEGSGNTILFTASSTVTNMLLMEDNDGRRVYKDVSDLALAMSVNKIEKVPASIVPEGVYGVIVDLDDYNVGADKGGAVNMFDDFDIDYNQQKYLIETRCSGGLTRPYSAIVLEAAD